MRAKPANPQDRRIRKTEQALIKALIDLVTETGYESTTIRDITHRADISYSTFFRHYEDKDALLLATLKSLIEELQNIVQKDSGPDMAALFTHVKKNPERYKVLISGNNILELAEKLVITEFINDNKNRWLSSIPIELVAHHVTNSIIGLVRWWVQNDLKISAQNMADIYDQLVAAPILEMSPNLQKK